MSFLEVQHINPGAVTNRMDKWAKIENSGLVIKTVLDGLDDIYEHVWRATPYKTGYLRSTIKTLAGDDFAAITVTARYAVYVEQGRSPTGPRRPARFFFSNITPYTMNIVLAVRQLYMVL